MKKFKIGNRVRVAKIDDYDFYSDANFEIGCVGIIVQLADVYDYEKIYYVKFDDDLYNGNPNYPDHCWAVLEDWLEPYRDLIHCE